MQFFLFLSFFIGLSHSQGFLGGLGNIFGGGGGGGNPFGGLFQQVATNPAFQNVIPVASQFFQAPQPQGIPNFFQTFMRPPPPPPAPAPAPSGGGGQPAPAGPAPVPDTSDYDEPLPVGKSQPAPIPAPAPPVPRAAAKAAPVQQGGGSNYDDIDYSLTGANPSG